MKVRCEGKVFKTFLWMKNEWICAWKILVRCLGGNFSRKTLKLHIPCLGGREVLPCLVANASEIKVFSNCFTRPWKSSSCCCINLQHIRYAWMQRMDLMFHYHCYKGQFMQRGLKLTRNGWTLSSRLKYLFQFLTNSFDVTALTFNCSRLYKYSFETVER